MTFEVVDTRVISNGQNTHSTGFRTAVKILTNYTELADFPLLICDYQKVNVGGREATITLLSVDARNVMSYSPYFLEFSHDHKTWSDLAVSPLLPQFNQYEGIHFIDWSALSNRAGFYRARGTR